jgi:hypothetical protein
LREDPRLPVQNGSLEAEMPGVKTGANLHSAAQKRRFPGFIPS